MASNRQMPRTPCASNSFVIFNASSTLVFSSINLNTFWFAGKSPVRLASSFPAARAAPAAALLKCHVHVKSPAQRQAQLGLREMKSEADGVICLPNQKVFKLIDENTSVDEALKITNELLAQGVRASGGCWPIRG